MSSSRLLDSLVGALAGALAGLLLALALMAEGMMAPMAGLIGLTTIDFGIGAHLLISALAGAGFGGLFRYHPGAYAAMISNGVIYGLIWWILGPLTLSPILMGRAPTWSLTEAGASFLNLAGHILYGAVTGLVFHMLASAYHALFPEELSPSTPEGHSPTRIVILGGGFGGVSTAQRLEQLVAGDKNYQVMLVSQSNYMLFTPMLAGVASNALEAQHISAPVRAACPNTGFRRATVETVDTQARQVRIRPGIGIRSETLEYDHLVLALGSVPDFHGMVGMKEHGFSLKRLEDAIALRNHVLATLERADVETDPDAKARQLTFVVVGGGFAGTELIAELFDMVHGVLHYYPHIDASDLRFILVHSGEQILPELGRGLGEYSLRKLQEKGIEFILGSHAIAGEGNAIQLEGGRRIETRTIVWTAGNQANPLLKEIPLERDRRGAVFTDRSLRARGSEIIWAIGDCAHVPDDQGQPYPLTAQHALRQGRLAAENILRSIRGEQPKEFGYRTLGLLVALGHHMGAGQIMGRRFSGIIAWFLWRGLYLSKLPGLEKKVRVSLDWILDLFFSRDIVLTADTDVVEAEDIRAPKR